MAKALTVKGIEGIKADTARRREVPDGGLTGLYLVVQPSGRKSWAVRYRAAGQSRKLTLGPYPALGLADAREAARAALRAASEGRDPAAEKKQKKTETGAGPEPGDMVKDVVEEFLKRHASRNRTARETQRIFDREVLPKWGARRIGDIRRRDVLELLDGIIDRGAPVMANRVLASIRKLGNWCVERELLEVSPAAHVSKPAEDPERDRVLSDEELRWFWLATARMETPFGPLFRILLLTAQRRDEVARMSEKEISEDIWTIPGERVKNGRTHRVPLTPQVRELLAAQPRIASEAGWIFTTNGRTPPSGFSRGKARLDALMREVADGAEIPPWRLHDLRRTAASGLGRLGYSAEVIERVLNHKSGKFEGVAGVYQRWQYDSEKREALTRWGQLVLAIGEGASRPEVPAFVMDV